MPRGEFPRRRTPRRSAFAAVAPRARPRLRCARATPSKSTAGWRALFPRIDFRLHRAPPDAPLPCRPAETRRDERAGAFSAEEGQDRYGTRRHRAGDPNVRPSGSRISLARAVSSQASFGRFFAIENRATPRFSTRTWPVPRGGPKVASSEEDFPQTCQTDFFFLRRLKRLGRFLKTRSIHSSSRRAVSDDSLPSRSRRSLVSHHLRHLRERERGTPACRAALRARPRPG